MNEKSDFDFWVDACVASNCYLFRLEQKGDSVLYVERPQDKDKRGNFIYSPRYSAFKGGKLLISDANYLAAYAVWERAAGLSQDDLKGLALYEAMR